MSAGGSHKHKENGENVRHRSTHASANGEAASEEKDYTPEQLQAVKKYVAIDIILENSDMLYTCINGALGRAG